MIVIITVGALILLFLISEMIIDALTTKKMNQLKMKSKKEAAACVDFLLLHENDIALNINGYGELKSLFVNIFERLPE